MYLHTGGFAETIQAGQSLRLQNLELKSGPVSINIVHPSAGESIRRQGVIRNGTLSIELPEFYEDIAVHIVSSSS